MLLRFCPSCGGRLPEIDTIKYCPACGGSLSAFLMPDTESPKPYANEPSGKLEDSAEEKSPAEILKSFDQFIAELQARGVEETEIRRQAAAMFAKIKTQMPARSQKHYAIQIDSERKDKKQEEHYSVVLKSVGNKDRVTRRLSEVLRRGMTATRMAIDMVPCVIVYKSRLKDIEAAVSIFEDERLHYAVLKGDFKSHVSIEEAIPNFHSLDNELKRTLLNASGVLWLGETVHLVVPEVEVDGEPGILVATDQGLYIFTGPPGRQHMEWQIVPYSRLTEVIFHDDDGGALELINKKYSREAWLRIADEAYLGQVYDHVRRMLLKQG